MLSLPTPRAPTGLCLTLLGIAAILVLALWVGCLGPQISQFIEMLSQDQQDDHLPFNRVSDLVQLGNFSE